MRARLYVLVFSLGLMGVSALVGPFGVIPAQASSQYAPAMTTVNTFGTCTAIAYNPTGDILNDAPLLIEYLDGFINNIYFCWLNQTLALIFRYVLYIVILIQSIMIWVINQANAILSWAVNGFIYKPLFYIAGIIRNTGNQIIEAIYFSGGRTTTIVTGSSSTFWDVLIAIVNGLSSAINSLTTGLSSIFGSLAGTLSTLILQLGETIRTALNDTAGVIIALINAILIIIVTIVTVIGAIILAIIQVLQTVVDIVGALALSLVQGVMGGFSEPVTNPLLSIPALATGTVAGQTGVCANQVVVHLCIGTYILDNTVFSAGSPATGAIYFVIAAVWFDRVMWALNKLKTIAK